VYLSGNFEDKIENQLLSLFFLVSFENTFVRRVILAVTAKLLNHSLLSWTCLGLRAGVP